MKTCLKLIVVVWSLGTVLHAQNCPPNLPTISSFSPASGPPGTRVLIRGADLCEITEVSFNGVPAQFGAGMLGEFFSATVPEAATTGPISVVNVSGRVTTSESFVVVPRGLPEIYSIFPDSAEVNRTITVRGTNLNDTLSVTINGVVASFVQGSYNDNLVVFVPTNATSGPITVRTRAGEVTSSQILTVIQPGAPRITSFSPTSGPPLTRVEVLGTELRHVTEVTVDGLPAQFVPSIINLGGNLTVWIPEGATTGQIKVRSPYGEAIADGRFEITTPPPPIVNWFFPDSGPPGMRVNLYGSGLVGVTAVKFNGQPAVFTARSSDYLVADLPFNATSGYITIESPRGTNVAPNPFTVWQPQISFTPSSGPPGTRFTIWGGYSAETTNVLFNGVPIAYQYDGQLTAVVPTNVASGPITVHTPQGVITSVTSFVVRAEHDLVLAKQFQPRSVVVGDPATIQLLAINRGPSSANAARLALIASSPVQSITVHFRDRTQHTQETNLVIDLEGLATGEVLPVSVTVVPLESGSASQSFSLSSPEYDRYPENNAATFTFGVTPPPSHSPDAEGPTLYSFAPAPNIIQLRWAAGLSNYVLQATTSPSQVDSWQTIDLPNGGNNVVLTNATPGTFRFFRLFRAE